MKKIKSTIAVALFVLSIFLPQYAISQSPEKMSYQSVIRNATGDLVVEGLVGIQISILQGSILGATEYVETHSAMTNVNGLVSIEIGMGTMITGTFAGIDWGNGPYFIKMDVDPSGGNSYSMSATSELLSVPYALYSETTGNPGAYQIDDLLDAKSDSSGSSLFLGIDAGLNDDGTENRNTALGFEALKSNTTGNNNTATGFSALFSNTTGFRNVANGNSALFSNTEGWENTAIGMQALLDNTIGYWNTAVGYSSLANNIGGYGNTTQGFQSLNRNTEGIENTAIGAQALFFNNIGNSNTAAGYFSLRSNTSGSGNTGIGYYALHPNTIGSQNTALGYQTLFTNTDGFNNTANGFQAGFTNIGSGNIFIGFQSGYYETTSSKLYIENSNADADNALIYGEFDTNILRTNSEFQIGNPSLTGYAFPTADGSANQVLQTDGSGSLSWNAPVENINDLEDGKSDADGSSLFLGIDAGLNDDGTDNNNVAIGFETLRLNTSGSRNSAAGYQALRNNTGSENSATGYQALLSNTTGTGNTANGFEALFKNNAGLNNTATGYNALYNIISGNWNTAIGSGALFNMISGTNNIGIGYQAQVPSVIESNQIRMGNTDIGYAGIQVAWSVTSDKRWKDNIRALPYGLEIVKQLEPVDYVRKDNDAKTREMGFIAQDVEALLTKVGYEDQGFLTKDDDGYISLRYNDFIALLTKAIQEQQEMIDELKEDSTTQEEKIDELKEENTVQAEALNSNTTLMKELQSIINQQSQK